jgi:hypothetical protein
MKTCPRSRFRRSSLIAAIGVLVAVLAACTGRGGGYLPPGPTVSDTLPETVFTGPASFGFTFSCEDKGGINPPTGQLRIQLAYTEHGTYLLTGSPFSIHGIVDTINDPVLESMICSGQIPPPEPGPPNELIFLGRYRPTTSPPPAGFPSTCPTRETKTTPLCRFEVEVHDNDRNLAPSTGDFFSIKLSSITETVTECPLGVDPPCFITEFPVGTVFYARAGLLAGGNLTVK